MKKYIFLICAVLLSSCSTIEPLPEPEEKTELEPLYDSNYERLARNVRVKSSDEYGITYEYKDVRIDEIAYMASEYCFKHKERQAILHDSQLFRNFSRRATFHCLELQN
ncbi:MAG: membrane lipoprotein lipid attachment site-containing protein [Alphaproteobacteria bacterium]|nr:membrane lipoprotein lipid attachment site-containing protein [Alphaproteobacteria bacterium]